jgi:4-amino-4-deoxy-L-arabinose transferase-like glycosyltransferase
MNQEAAEEQRRDWVWMTLILCAGLTFRAAALFGFEHVPASDELAYISMALNLVSGYGIVDGMGNYAMFNVGYPIFILSPVFFFFGAELLAVRAFNMLLGGVVIILSYLVAREAGAGRLGRLTAATIWAVYLPASVFGVYLLKENLMTPLMLGVMWCALRLVRRPSMTVAAGCGALFGLLALTGNAALSLTVVSALALVLAPTAIPQRVILAMVMLTVAVAVCVPWMMRNMQVIGAPVLNTNGGFNLYLGNNPAATGMFVSILDTPRGSTWTDLRERGEVQASETLKQEALAWIRTNPFDFLTLSLKKAVYFWTPSFYEASGDATFAEKVVRALSAIQFVLLVAAALSTLLLKGLRTKQLVILWLAIGCYTAVHMLFYVMFRYREPIMPVLGVTAALAIESLLSGMSLPSSNSMRRTAMTGRR